MCLKFKISESTRSILAMVSAVACGLLAVSGGFLMCVCFYMKSQIDDQILLLQDYDTGLLPHFLISVGTLLIIVNAVGTKIAYDCSEQESREKLRPFLVFFLILMFIISVVTFAGGMMCFSHKAIIEDAFHVGLKAAMKRYKKELPVKVSIDKIQIQSRCCGSRLYKDWFNVGWINTEFIDVTDPKVKEKMRDGDIFTDDVPFSCCNASALRPCIHHSVTDTEIHVKYKEVTLNKIGCTDALIADLEEKVLSPIGIFVVVIFLTQTLTLLMLRVLQTSIQSAHDFGDSEGSAYAYIFPDCPGTCCETGDSNQYVKAGMFDDGKEEKKAEEEEDHEKEKKKKKKSKKKKDSQAET